jgi:hypothetical protein
MNGWPAGKLTGCLVTDQLDGWQDSVLDWLNDWLMFIWLPCCFVDWLASCIHIAFFIL